MKGSEPATKPKERVSVVVVKVFGEPAPSRYGASVAQGVYTVSK